MAKIVQVRRGTTAELSSVTGAEGELFVDTDKETLTVHNNYQAGGFPLLREDLNNLAANTINISKLQHGSATAGQTIVVNSAANGLAYGSGFDELSDVGVWLDNAGGEGPAGPSSNAITERYGAIDIFGASKLNMRTAGGGAVQIITITDAGDYFIKIAGAQGGGYQGGLGGHAWGVKTLAAGDVLYCRVGQAGLMGGQNATSTTPIDGETTIFYDDITGANNLGGGGYGDGRGGNGAGSATGNTNSGGGGTAIRHNTDAIANRIIVAGGGGGGYLEGERFASGSSSPPGGGGHGGGSVGLPPDKISEGSAARTRGGTQSGGGAAGAGGNAGASAASGGAGGNGPSNDGGGGGGGYTGGSSSTNAAGAGGSGYVGGMNAANRGFSAGGNAGHGWIYIRKVG